MKLYISDNKFRIRLWIAFTAICTCSITTEVTYAVLKFRYSSKYCTKSKRSVYEGNDNKHFQISKVGTKSQNVWKISIGSVT